MHEYVCNCCCCFDDGPLPPLRHRGRAGTHSPPFLHGLALPFAPDSPSPPHGSICVLQFRPVIGQMTKNENVITFFFIDIITIVIRLDIEVRKKSFVLNDKETYYSQISQILSSINLYFFLIISSLDSFDILNVMIFHFLRTSNR